MVSFIYLQHVSSGIDAGLRLTDCTAPKMVSVPKLSTQILVPELSGKCKMAAYAVVRVTPSDGQRAATRTQEEDPIQPLVMKALSLRRLTPLILICAKSLGAPSFQPYRNPPIAGA